MERFAGVDLASQPAGTGVVRLDVHDDGRAVAIEMPSADDAALVSLAAQVDVLGIDCPLGWPMPFVAAVVAHEGHGPWPGSADRSSLTHRTTDLALKNSKAAMPLSVSADKLGSTAMRCALLQHEWATHVWGEPAARDGSGPLVEVYPAAALRAWRIPTEGYKGSGPKAAAGHAARAAVVERLVAEAGAWLDVSAVEARCIESDHVLDALVSAIVAIAAKRGRTRWPTPVEAHAARIEGCIHVPTTSLTALHMPSSG